MPFVAIRVSVHATSVFRKDENGDEYLISDLYPCGQSLDPETLWSLAEEADSADLMEEMIHILTTKP